jgi:hypothetical protein
MNPLRLKPPWALCLAALVTALPVAANDSAPPTSAGDISGNVRSFFDNLGKGVKITPNRTIVATGYLPGRGQGVCYEGEKLPVIVQPETAGQIGGKLQIALLPCDALIANGAFQRVATTTAAAAPGVAPAPAKPTDYPPPPPGYLERSKGEMCLSVLIPRTTDHLCVRRDGTPTGEVYDRTVGWRRMATDDDYRKVGLQRRAEAPR